ncbi:MAG: hypothetical protein ACRDZU_14155 [Acidimicrobiales bacterium]
MVWLTAGVAVLAIAPAGAQQDPYGNTSTTAAPDSGLVPTCSFDLRTGSPGDTGELHVENVPFGGTVRVLIGGAEAGRATAPLAAQAAGAPVRFGGTALPAQARATTLDIPFTVPDLPPGQHTVTAVGVDFALTCDPGGLEVLAASEKSRGGFLPRTGIYIALLLVIAIVLLIVGRRLVSASRRRRLDMERARPSSHQHARLRS